MSMPERDLRWTEWIRHHRDQILNDIKRLEERWKSAQSLDSREHLRARWVMWTLTTTVRLLRDHATRTLYWFGCREPKALFDLTLESLDINDPYVPERMLAACYGIAMSLWVDPRGEELRKELPEFAKKLVDEMFIPGAPHATRHVLMRDYALGIIELANRVAPGSISDEKKKYLQPPFSYIPSPFPDPKDINDSDLAEVEGAIYMDFGNYTIGHLIPDRRNYDFSNPTYQKIRRQIEYRILELGYKSSLFSEIDKEISDLSWRAESRNEPKIDRYGKKYSWIAYFEMYGKRLDEGILPEWRQDERCPDLDIDPSFPEPAKIWHPPLPDLFANTPTELRAWIASGPTPDYENLLHCDEVDSLQGPWILLNGFIEQSSIDDDRKIFTFLRGLLVEDSKVENLIEKFKKIKYPGNMAIPEPREDYYTYAGEIPWSTQFGRELRTSDGKVLRDIREAFTRNDSYHWGPGIPVEIPVYRFSWEGYHSALNSVSGITVPSPALSEYLKLSNQQGEWDLYDSEGHIATIYREFRDSTDSSRSYLLYIKADMIDAYLKYTSQTLVWLIWGEREFKYGKSHEIGDELQDIWAECEHIHRFSSVWNT